MGIYDWDDIQQEEITELYRRKVAVGENMMCARVEVKAGAFTQPHSHPNEELIIVLKGMWRFYLPDGELTVGPNQVLSIPAGAVHSSEVIEDTVALEISAGRSDFITGEDKFIHHDPDQLLWAV